MATPPPGDRAAFYAEYDNDEFSPSGAQAAVPPRQSGDERDLEGRAASLGSGLRSYSRDQDDTSFVSYVTDDDAAPVAPASADAGTPLSTSDDSGGDTSYISPSEDDASLRGSLGLTREDSHFYRPAREGRSAANEGGEGKEGKEGTEGAEGKDGGQGKDGGEANTADTDSDAAPPRPLLEQLMQLGRMVAMASSYADQWDRDDATPMDPDQFNAALNTFINKRYPITELTAMESQALFEAADISLSGHVSWQQLHDVVEGAYGKMPRFSGKEEGKEGGEGNDSTGGKGGKVAEDHDSADSSAGEGGGKASPGGSRRSPRPTPLLPQITCSVTRGIEKEQRRRQVWESRKERSQSCNNFVHSLPYESPEGGGRQGAQGGQGIPRSNQIKLPGGFRRWHVASREASLDTNKGGAPLSTVLGTMRQMSGEDNRTQPSSPNSRVGDGVGMRRLSGDYTAVNNNATASTTATANSPLSSSASNASNASPGRSPGRRSPNLMSSPFHHSAHSVAEAAGAPSPPPKKAHWFLEWLDGLDSKGTMYAGFAGGVPCVDDDSKTVEWGELGGSPMVRGSYVEANQGPRAPSSAGLAQHLLDGDRRGG